MNIGDIFDAPRASVYGLGRSISRGFDKGTDDWVSALPALLGIGGGLIAAPFTGGTSIPIGLGLATGAQVGGKLLGDSRFDAPEVSELYKELGFDPNNALGVTALHMLTDPLTWYGGYGAFKGAGKLAGGLKKLDAGVELAGTPMGTALKAHGGKIGEAMGGLGGFGKNPGVLPPGQLSEAWKDMATKQTAALSDAVEASMESPEWLLKGLRNNTPINELPAAARRELAKMGAGPIAEAPTVGLTQQSPLLQALAESAPSSAPTGALRSGLTSPTDALLVNETLSPLARGGSGMKPVIPYPGRRQVSLMNDPEALLAQAGRGYRVPPPVERYAPSAGQVPPPGYLRNL